MLVEKIYNIADTFHSMRLYNFYKGAKIDSVIDVGSHKGEFIQKVVRDKKIPIFSFEPQESVRDELKKNTQDFNVIEYYDCALSDTNGDIEIFLNKLTSTSSLISPNKNSLWIRFKQFVLAGKIITGKQKITSRRLDDVFKNINLDNFNNILLKIDVEGAESIVLKGGSNILNNKNVKYIQIESANFNIYKQDSNSPINIIEEHGFIAAKKFLFPMLNFTDIVFERKN